MELQSLLFFHFILNSQSRLVAQAYVCWRIYSGDCYKKLLSHLLYFKYVNYLTFCYIVNYCWFFREDEYLVNMQHTVIPSWYQRQGYIKAMANLIEKELKSFDCPEEVQHFVDVLNLNDLYRKGHGSLTFFIIQILTVW